MAETNPQVVNLPARLPDQIVVTAQLTPNEMRALKTHTGRSLQELIGGDAEDMDLLPDRTQALVWVALRRAGYQDVTFEEAGDVAAVMDTPAAPDPTATGS
jgi:hypothetical protein